MRRLDGALRGAWRAITRLGRTVALVAILAWVGAWSSGWEELAVIAATCAIALAIAVVFTLGSSAYEIELDLRPERVIVGERAGGELIVRNVGRRRAMPVRLELVVGEAVPAFRVPSLAREAEHDELFSIPTTRRAIIPVGPAAVVRGDPVGMLRRERWSPDSTELYVHPQISSLSRLGSGFLRDLEGQTTQDLSPSDVAFHTLREYVPGDDLRHIHWKTTARIGTLMVRQFVDTRRSFLSIIVSTDPVDYASRDEFELAISMAASIGVRALRDDQTVAFVAGDRAIASPRPVSLLDAVSGIDYTDEHGSLQSGIAVANRAAADASIVALAVGTTSTIADIRAAAARLKADARILVFRADLGGDGGFRSIGDTTVINAPSLDAYGRMLFQVSQS